MSNQLEVRVVDSAERLAIINAELFVAEAVKSVGRSNRFMVAISGGSTPRRSHRLLATAGYSERIPWSAINLFWVDDRCVDSDDPASNYGSARSDFVGVVDIPDSQVYPMPTDVEPQNGAVKYEQTITSTFGLQTGVIPQFDCIFLGMGTDGHTGSLFPGQEDMWDRKKMVLAVRGGRPNVDRLTMGLPLINRAKHVVILVSGPEKAGLVRDIFTHTKEGYPVQQIRPVAGKVTWLLDQQASRLLPDKYLVSAA